MIWIRTGSAFMFIAVMLGAFGAHGLKHKLSAEMLAVFETGVRYQFYHALGLLAVGWLAETHPHTMVTSAGWAFTIGILLFSMTLYILSMTGLTWLGAITPLGGLAFLIGWVLIFISTFK